MWPVPLVLVVDVVVEVVVVVVVVVDAAAIVAADAVTAASLIELAEGEEDEREEEEEDENELEVVDMDAEVKEDGTEIKMPLRKPYFVLIWRGLNVRSNDEADGIVEDEVMGDACGSNELLLGEEEEEEKEEEEEEEEDEDSVTGLVELYCVAASWEAVLKSLADPFLSAIRPSRPPNRCMVVNPGAYKKSQMLIDKFLHKHTYKTIHTHTCIASLS